MTKPSKQAVRDWMRRGVQEHRAPQSPEEVRDELGWHMDREDEAIVAEYSTKARAEDD